MNNREQRAKRRARRRVKSALGPHRWALAQQQKRLAREAAQAQQKQDDEARRERLAQATAVNPRRKAWDVRQRAINAAVGVMAARLKAREEARARRDWELTQADDAAPMVSAHWSPTSGRQ